MCVCDFIGYLSVSRTRDLNATCKRPCNSAWFHLSVGDLSVAILRVTLEPSRDVLVSTVEFMGYFFHRTELLESFGSCAAMRSLQPKFHACIRMLRTYFMRNMSTQKYKRLQEYNYTMASR